MTNKKLVSFATAVGTAATVALSVYTFVVRPWHLRWGATDGEVEQALPGDELLPDAQIKSTRAITIQAPVANVWPWLLQWGYQRGGLYSYDWIDRALGSEGVVSTNRILPEFQHLEVGEDVPTAPGNGFKVATIDASGPSRTLVLYARYDMATGQQYTLDDPLTGDYMQTIWTWQLEPINDETTRMITRMRLDHPPVFKKVLFYRTFVEPGSFIMEQRMMKGIKERAETLYNA